MATVEGSENGKFPRTARGERTRRKLLDAALLEFGEKGFHEASVSSITRRAGVALGSFYTYFDTKDALFRDLVKDLSNTIREGAAEVLSTPRDALGSEHAALAAFLHFAQDHNEIYRIIDEAEFVHPESYREHYETTALRFHNRLKDGMAKGELRDDLEEIHAWAMMGMNVFLGLRYAVWGEPDEDLDRVAQAANSILTKGIAATAKPKAGES